LGFDINWAGIEAKQQVLTLDQLIRNLEAVYDTMSGVSVTPETALLSPTVVAVVRTISNRISSLPVHVYQKGRSKGRETKELLPTHPVARLLSRPNEYQDRVSYWLDATSWLIRYGNFYAFKGRGDTGPIRRLESLPPSAVTVEQLDDLSLRYRVTSSSQGQRTYTSRQIHHARGVGRSGFMGDSPIMNLRESIALEIAAEKFGGSFFGNGAMPLIMFTYLQGSAGHKTDEDRQRFIDEFQAAYRGKGRFRAMLLPRGIDAKDPIPMDNDKAQFLQTRKYQRTVIAGGLGVPPHHVGDLERATFNNVEQQSLDFDINCVLPYGRIFEAAMERDLLTDDDRAGGIIIRFNFDATLRADFRTRQEGLQIQRNNGVINPNEWREQEGKNPRTDPGGDEYWDEGPSGQGTEPAQATLPAEDNGRPAPAPVLVED
jgi:HK97 family phage portal protein